ncbi:MAG: hypothetical protein CL582_22345 [Alteromonadaceae bacterium]|nr:hypothetical protein [Alteromonadaceae bacterium]|tara:strand:- start:4158 stop:4370 length:213 start_codon:yes stop_codon:yes gene_type:complete
MARKAEYVKDINVVVPESDESVTMEVWREPYTGKLFALESDFVGSSSSARGGTAIIKSPYTNLEVRIESL